MNYDYKIIINSGNNFFNSYNYILNNNNININIIVNYDYLNTYLFNQNFPIVQNIIPTNNGMQTDINNSFGFRLAELAGFALFDNALGRQLINEEEMTDGTIIVDNANINNNIYTGDLKNVFINQILDIFNNDSLFIYNQYINFTNLYATNNSQNFNFYNYEFQFLMKYTSNVVNTNTSFEYNLLISLL